MAGNSYICSSPNQPALMRHFHAECEKRGIRHEPASVFQYLNAFEDRQSGGQPALF
ncbi:MAG: hypothetical protein LBL15_06525 [Oscillospiraceae bacterium]|jgi:hypothetical protein|nr:hypothetical protein [Oscillospiraceae bacterium]